MERSLLNWGLSNSDPETLTNTTVNPSDRNFLNEVLKSDAQRMKECIANLENDSLNLDEKENSINLMIALTEEIDNAIDLVKIDGLKPLIKLLDNEQLSLRIGAAWALGNSLQNNPFVITAFSDMGGLEVLLNHLKETKDDEFRSKLSYMLSGYLNHVTNGPHEFIMKKGFDLMKNILMLPEDISTKKKIVFKLGQCTCIPEWSESLRKEGILDLLADILSIVNDSDLKEFILDAIKSSANTNDNITYIRQNITKKIADWSQKESDLDDEKRDLIQKIVNI